MKTARIEDMVKGWFVGDFEPTLYRTRNVEVAVKRYLAGECEKKHFHKIATEITVIIDGEARMNGNTYCTGDIIIIEPNKSTDFCVIQNTITVVVKIPGARNDKYFVKNATRTLKLPDMRRKQQ